MLNSFHSHHNTEHPADPVKLVAELASFLTGLRVAQRICKKILILTFPVKQNEANEDENKTND